MYVLWIFPTEHKWKPDRRIAMIYSSLLSDENKFIELLQEHKEELGITLDNKEIKRIVKEYDLHELNYHMSLGLIEDFEDNVFYGLG